MNQIIKNIIRKLHGKLSPMEEKSFKAWLNENKTNRQVFEKIQKIKTYYDHSKIENLSVKDDWEEIERKLKSRQSSGRKSFYKAAIAAAIFIGLLFTSIQLYRANYNKTVTPTSSKVVISDGKKIIKEINEAQNADLMDTNGEILAKQQANQISYYKTKSSSVKYNTIYIPNGKKFTIILSDSTIVELNAGSELKYPTSFNDSDNRTVYLKGEAYFDVTKNPEQPFVINTDNIDIKVLGTSFNVSAYKNESTTKVALAEGLVELQSKDAAFTSQRLVPNQIATVDKINKRLNIRTGDITPYTAWRKGKLIIDKESFNIIINRLERTYNVTIDNSYKALDSQKFTASFDSESIEDVLESFKLSFPFEYTLNHDTNHIIIKNPKNK